MKLTERTVYPGGALVDVELAGGRRICTFVASLNGYTIYGFVGMRGILISRDKGVRGSQMSTQNSHRAKCNKDSMTDAIVCAVEVTSAPPGGDPVAALSITDNGLCIPANTFPQTDAMVRVGDAPAVKVPHADEACLSEAEAKPVVAAIVAGQRLRLRYFEWPYKEPRDIEIATAGIKEALAVRDWLREQATAGKLQ